MEDRKEKDFSILNNKKNKIVLESNIGNEFKKDIISSQCNVHEVLKFMCVDEEVQRDLDPIKVAAISRYIQNGLEEGNIYFSPLIFSARSLGEYENGAFSLNMTDKLIVLDGQHRIMGFDTVKKRLLTLIDKNPEDNELKRKYEKLINFPVSIKIYRFLSQQEERQLFTDINTKASAVSNTILIMYKTDDLYAKLVKDIVFNHKDIGQENFEMRARSTKKKLMTITTLYKISKALNQGSYLLNDKSKINEDNYEIYKKNTEEFLSLLNKNLNFEIYGDRDKYLIYMPSILIGIAIYINKMKKEFPDITMRYMFENIINKINWTHKNIDFGKIASKFNKKTNKYQFNSPTRVKIGISEYLLEKSNKGEQYRWEI